MGLRPSEVYTTPLYDLNRMADAFQSSQKDQWHYLRVHAWLVSLYSDLDKKSRKKLTPEKMLSLADYENAPDPDVIQEWQKFFQRKTISKTVYN